MPANFFLNPAANLTLLLILVGLQLALWWLIMSVLAELSGRTAGREAR